MISTRGLNGPRQLERRSSTGPACLCITGRKSLASTSPPSCGRITIRGLVGESLHGNEGALRHFRPRDRRRAALGCRLQGGDRPCRKPLTSQRHNLRRPARRMRRAAGMPSHHHRQHRRFRATEAAWHRDLNAVEPSGIVAFDFTSQPFSVACRRPSVQRPSPPRSAATWQPTPPP